MPDTMAIMMPPMALAMDCTCCGLVGGSTLVVKREETYAGDDGAHFRGWFEMGLKEEFSGCCTDSLEVGGVEVWKE